MTRGRSRQAGLPGLSGLLCSATAKRTGMRCRRFAIVGSTVCDVPGGKTPNTVAARDRRATIAQLLQHEDPDRPRPLGEVMLDAVHNADVLMGSLEDVRLRVARREEVDPADIDRLVRMSQVAHALAETTVRAGVQVELVRQARLSREADAAFVTRVLGRVLDALLGGRAAPWRPWARRRWTSCGGGSTRSSGWELEAVEEPDMARADPDAPPKLTGRPVAYPPPPSLAREERP